MGLHAGRGTTLNIHGGGGRAKGFLWLLVQAKNGFLDNLVVWFDSVWLFSNETSYTGRSNCLFKGNPRPARTFWGTVWATSPLGE